MTKSLPFISFRAVFSALIRMGGFLFLFAFLNLFSLAAAQELSSPDAVLERSELQPAISAFRRGELEVAYRLFAKAREADAEISSPGVLTAFLCSRSGDSQGMYRYLAKSVEEFPNDPEAWLQLGDLAIQEGRLVEAKLLLERGDEILVRLEKAVTSDSPRFRYLREESLALAARLAEERGETERALEIMNRLIQYSPQNDAAHTSVGWLLFGQGRLSEAEAAFDRARQIEPSNLVGWLMVVRLLDRAGKTQEAQNLFDQRFVPSEIEPAARSQAIRLLLKWNRLERAREQIEAMPNDSVDRHNLAGRLALFGDDYFQAEKEFQAGLFLDPNNFTAGNGYALALAEQENAAKLHQALEIARRNRQRYTDSEEATATLGWLEYLDGRTERADDLLRPILESGSFSPTTAYYLAEMANERSDRLLAAKLLEMALGQDEMFPKRAAAENLQKEMKKTVDAPAP